MAFTFLNLENGGESTLRGDHAAGDGSLKVQVGDGARFGSTWPARVTVIHPSTGVHVHFKLTGRTGNDLTIGAMIEGSTDIALPTDSKVEMRWTKGAATDIYAAINASQASGPAGLDGQLQVRRGAVFDAIAGTVTGDNSITVGRLCIANASDSIVGGYSSTVGDIGSGQMFAMGFHCVTGGESGCVATGYYCEAVDAIGDGGCTVAVAMGWCNRSQSCASFVIGSNGLGDVRNKFVIGGGAFTGSNVIGAGQCQPTILPLIGTSTNTTPVVLSTDGAGGPGNTVFRPIVRPGCTYAFTATVVGRKTDGSAHAMFIRQFMLHNEGGTTALVGSVGTIGTDINTPGWSVAITADNTNDAAQVAATGEATVHWGCRLDAVEVG